MKQFSPGPWHIEDDNTIQESGGGIIATIFFPDDFPCFVSESAKEEAHANENSKANARLIAAAPEMHAKLEKLATWIESNAGVHEKYAANCRDFPSIVESSLADAKNYRATAKDIRKLLANAMGKPRKGQDDEIFYARASR